MTFTTMTGGAVALGLAALALALYLLQRIRVRHEEVFVVTTLFWREALEESRARTLVERFRHPLAYALALLLGGLLWFAAAGPDHAREAGPRHVLLLDGSAGMALPGRFAAATAALERELEALPRDRTEVLWCGADVSTLLAPGEDRALLRARLAGHAPEAAPASVERALVARAGGGAGFVGSGYVERAASGARRADAGQAPRQSDAQLRCVVFGDAPVRAAAYTLALDAARGAGRELNVARAQAGAPAAPEAVGSGVTALGVSPSASGAWTTVDVLVAVRGVGAAERQVALTLADPSALPAGAASAGPSAAAAPAPPPDTLAGAVRTVLAPDHVELLLRDVPANGRMLQVALTPSDALAADDVASVLLPERPRIRVALAADLAAAIGGEALEALRSALAADSAVEVVPDRANANVVFTATADAAQPALVFASAADQVEAILLGHAPGLDSRDVIARALGELGLDRLDAATLAAELGRELAVGAAPLAAAGPARRVSLWRELVAPGVTGFLEERAFPLLIGRAVRWLAEAPSVTPYVAVGRTVPHRIADVASAVTASVELAEVARVADRGASLLLGALPPLAQPAGVLAPDADAYAPAGLPPVTASEGPGGWRALTWLLLVALVLTCAEWALFQRGRMP
ncbi:MAG: VWA domain-containing protein [Planctomycetota bacterium]